MLATDAWMVSLRIVHIVTGAIWVGSLTVVVLFIQPIAASIGPAAGPFMMELRRRRLVDIILVDALITIAAGSVMYWRDWHLHASFGDWIDTRFGATLTVGALLAIAVIPIAALVTRPTIGRLVALGRQAAEGGATADLGAQIATAQRRLKIAERTTLALALLAVVAMSSARYL